MDKAREADGTLLQVATAIAKVLSGKPLDATVFDVAYDRVTCEAIANAAIDAYIAAQWRPIESAPKDGTRVLLWTAEWEAANSGCMFGLGWGQYDHIWKHQPTHWQPLPTPPEQQPPKPSS